MTNKSSILAITARELLDSRGNPTVEAEVRLASGVVGSALVPSGASTGTHEAYELRDSEKHRYLGKGTLAAVEHVKTTIAEKLVGMDVFDQKMLDKTLIDLDGTEHKEKLGANAILSVSLAAARAAALEKKIPLYQYLRDTFWPDAKNWKLPVPMMNVLNGGKHAIGSVDMQEFMIVPVGAESFNEAMRMGVEVYHTLKKILHEKGFAVGLGDEGGFMPRLTSHKQVLELLVAAIEQAGYKPGGDFGIALDPAASEFYRDTRYYLAIEDKKLTNEQLVDLYISWCEEFPIVSIEDGLFEDDWDGFAYMTKKLGRYVQIVGDDLYVTNSTRLDRGIKEKSTNSILVKLNQIGTLTETADVIQKAQDANMTTIISHRSGETEDAFIADLAVACNAGQIKIGAPARSDRVAKYNQLLRIEEKLSTSSYTSPF